ncbi:MAG TPA: hypothetical protein PKJ43_05410, partial [Prolixibacteraceae bacterium]|nr:hypothetical protein [Prolixibacteraceae bacterium]
PGTTSPIQQKTTTKHSYFAINALYDKYFEIRKRLTLGLLAEGVYSTRGLSSNYTEAIIAAPAFQPTPNSKSMYLEKYHANQYLATGGKILFKLNDNLHLRSEVYGFFPIRDFVLGPDNSVSYHNDSFSRASFMGLAAAVYHTPLGPLSAEVNYYEKAGQKWFFSLNLGYMIFNKRGL